MAYARDRLPLDEPIVFAHRYITRPHGAGGEHYVPLNEVEFERRQRYGWFAMVWRSHGLRYGLGVEIRSWMANGLHVVVNGSRAYLDQASELFPDLVPVLVQASQSTLRQRLLARGREGGEELEGRIARAVGLDREIDHPDLRRIDNDADLAAAGQRFLAVLTGHG
jgi:ribose 1,5-bisphosphokinase